MWGGCRAGGQYANGEGRDYISLLFRSGRPAGRKRMFAAGIAQAGLILHFLARSRGIRILRYTLAPEPLDDTDHRPLHNLEEPLTMRHKSSRERYTMALPGTAGLALIGQNWVTVFKAQ